LHGLGDTNASFERLGKQLALPETTCLSVRGPKGLPFDLGGFHWGDDIIFDQATGGMDLDTGFEGTNSVLAEHIIRQTLIGKCGYRLREIVLLGFGQGGMAALSAAMYLHHAGHSNPSEELGGVISIGGPVPDGSRISTTQKAKSAVLLCRGNTKSAVDQSAIDKIKGCFEFVEVCSWRKVGDSMPASREEMLPVMQFFARRLRSRRGVPEGSVEI
jgi:predicted esterase